MRTATVDPQTGLMKLASTSPRRPRAEMFEGAAVDRFTQDWVTNGMTMDSLLETKLPRLQARSSQLVKSDGYAANWIRQTLSNVIGDGGFRLKMQIKNKRGIGPDKKANEAVEAAWKDFCRADNFTVAGNATEHQFDALMLRSIAIKGGSLARIVRGFGENSYRFAFQGLPVELLDPEFFDNRRNIRMSVQKDQYDRPAAYHLLKHHPEDRWLGRSVTGERIVRPAKEILHAFVMEEFGQSQGVPWLAPVMSRLRQLHGYEEAEVIAARAQASKIGFFEVDPLTGGEYTGEGTDSFGNKKMDGSPGSFETLPAGYKANLIDPTHPNGNYNEFRKGVLRGVAAGIIVNYNLLGQDLEGVNYSSIRQGVLSERDMWKMIQRWYIETVKIPMFTAWLEWSILRGALPFDFTEFDRINAPSFTGRRWEWVDPDKDSKAEERRLINRLTSHQRIARQRGEDLEEILREVKDDQELAEQMQLDLMLDLPGPTSEPDQPEA